MNWTPRFHIVLLCLTLCAHAEQPTDALAPAMAAINAGKWDSAIVELTKVIDADASHAEAHFWRGFAYAKGNDPTRAWEDVRKAQMLGYDRFNPVWAGQLRENSEFERLVAGWKERLKEHQRQIVAVGDSSDPKIAGMKKRALDEISSLAKSVGEIEKKRDIASALEKSESAYHITVQLDIENQFRQVRKIEGIRTYQQAASGGNIDPLAVIYIVPAVSDLRILPRDPYVRGEITDTISISATPGEYEPASFVVSASEDLSGVKVVAGDLKASGGATIPADCIDIKLVKCWFQATEAWYGLQARDPAGAARKVLVPELLLNDDTLVKVDLDKQEQQVRLSLPDGDQYVSMTDPDAPAWTGWPVKDADSLRPLYIPAGQNQQFWIEAKVPADATADAYTGTISITTENHKSSIELKLNLTVLPFALEKPYYVSSIFYTSSRYATDLKYLQEHGITNPVIFYFLGMAEPAVIDMLQTRKDLGLSGQPLYLYQYTTSVENSLIGDIKQVRRVLELARSYGVTDVYFYGLDEVSGQTLAAQRPYWQAIHDAGGKVMQAGGIKQGNYEIVGDILDILVSGYHPSKADADKWHSQGRKIWNYANPQGGIENPEIWRRNYGLLLWRENFDGAATWMDFTGTANPWNDFDFKPANYRDQVFFYPTDTGIIDAIAIKGYREAVDDVRYMTTLEKAIEKAPASDQRTAAEKFVAELRTGNRIIEDDLHAIRARIIEHLLAIQ